MTTDKGIPIKNIYYMLTYAFKELRHNNYETIAGEDFKDIYDLFAEILSRGIAYLLKQGLHREYVGKEEALTTLRGKLNIRDSIRERINQRTRLVCEFDIFSENNLFNQILKSAAMLLLRHADVKSQRKHTLRRLLLMFEEVDCIKPDAIRWGTLRYDRNTRVYEMLHSLCHFLLHSKLLTTENGQVKMEQFSDDHMNLLFQRFVLEYYKRHFPQYKACAKQIYWNIGNGDNVAVNLLPAMLTDICLTLGERTLIIDTKYYASTTQENFGRYSIHSSNLYQIHAYVTNEDKQHTGRVDGMLLYAKTLEEIQPEAKFTNGDGNTFLVRTLDLGQDFNGIKSALDRLTEYHST